MGRPKGGRGLEQVVCYYCGPKKPKISEKNYKRHLRDIHNDHSAVSKVYGYKALRFNKGGGRRSHTGDGESMHNGGERGTLSEESTQNEMMISINGPLLQHCEAVVEEAMDLYWSKTQVSDYFSQ